MVDTTPKDAIISNIKTRCRNQDMVHVQMYGQFQNKKTVERISELMLENIIPIKLRRNVEVNVWVHTALEEQAGGYCWGDKKEVEIEIARTSEGYRFSREEMLINLTHELVHAKQFISGHLSGKAMSTWKRSDHSKTPYSQQPWEREAYYWEKRLYEQYFKKLNA